MLQKRMVQKKKRIRQGKVRPRMAVYRQPFKISENHLRAPSKWKNVYSRKHTKSL